MRIGLVEFLLILAIASLTIGPQVALFVDRWLRRANRVNARAARRRAEYAAQAAAERDALLKRFRTASTVFGVCILLALVYTLVFRPIDTPPQAYDAPAVRQDTGAAQTALAADDKGTLDLGEYQNVDCIRALRLSTASPPPTASTELECSTVTRSVLIIWVGMALVASFASRPSRCRCKAAFWCTVPSNRLNFA